MSLVLSSIQDIYKVNFTLEDIGNVNFDFYFRLESLPNGYSFYPSLNFTIGNDIVHEGQIYSNDNSVIAFIYNFDEIENSIFNYNEHYLLSTSISSSNLSLNFTFYDTVFDQYVYSYDINIGRDLYVDSILNNFYTENIIQINERDLIYNNYINELKEDNNSLNDRIDNLINSQNSFDNVFDLMLEGTRPVVHLLSQEIGPGISIGSIVLIPVAFSVVAFLIKGLIL